ncbi:MAG: hypothetical protein H0X72_18935 [Acidobacteria bacterium]|nr:hypothetical protein [Acidobacteriota bacterium]
MIGSAGILPAMSVVSTRKFPLPISAIIFNESFRAFALIAGRMPALPAKTRLALID